MSDGQLISAEEFGTYLGDETLDKERANSILQKTQDACEDVRNPIPNRKFYVLYRVAERAYTGGRNQGRGYQFAASGVDDGGAPSAAGVYLTQWDRDDLLRGDDGQVDDLPAPSAFTIHTRPSVASALDAYSVRYGGSYW